MHEYTIYYSFVGYEVNTTINTELTAEEDIFVLGRNKLVSLGVDMKNASNEWIN